VIGYSPVEFEQDVKAVTYHEADVRYENGMWSTTLVFDI
jgi:SHS2 domain-containing protein